jgi:hypothetical protein
MRELKESNAAMWINVMVRINLTHFMIIHWSIKFHLRVFRMLKASSMSNTIATTANVQSRRFDRSW